MFSGYYQIVRVPASYQPHEYSRSPFLGSTITSIALATMSIIFCRSRTTLSNLCILPLRPPLSSDATLERIVDVVHLRLLTVAKALAQEKGREPRHRPWQPIHGPQQLPTASYLYS